MVKGYFKRDVRLVNVFIVLFTFLTCITIAALPAFADEDKFEKLAKTAKEVLRRCAEETIKEDAQKLERSIAELQASLEFTSLTQPEVKVIELTFHGELPKWSFTDNTVDCLEQETALLLWEELDKDDSDPAGGTTPGGGSGGTPGGPLGGAPGGGGSPFGGSGGGTGGGFSGGGGSGIDLPGFIHFCSLGGGLRIPLGEGDIGAYIDPFGGSVGIRWRPNDSTTVTLEAESNEVAISCVWVF